LDKSIIEIDNNIDNNSALPACDIPIYATIKSVNNLKYIAFLIMIF